MPTASGIARPPTVGRIDARIVDNYASPYLDGAPHANLRCWPCWPCWRRLASFAVTAYDVDILGKVFWTEEK
jgi:hypothetical protein